MNKTDCIFCQLAKENIQNSKRILIQSEGYFVMLSSHPQTIGHLLVIPNRHIETLKELSVKETTEFFAAAISMGEQLTVLLGAKAFTLKVNNQLFKLESSDKGHVGHIHIHVIPRYSQKDDLVSQPREVREDQLEIIRQQLLKKR